MEGTSEFWAAIAGAIVGTLGSGAVSWWLQRQQIESEKKERRRQEFERQQALAKVMLLKMIRIASNCDQISKHIEGQFKAHTEQPWQFTRPIVNMPDPVYFSPDELSMLLSLGDDKSFNRTADVDVAHNALLAGTSRMFQERETLVSNLTPDTVDGLLGQSTAPFSQKFILHANIVNDLIFQIRERAKGEADFTAKLLSDMASVLNDKLSLKIRLKPNRPPQDQQ